MLTDVDVPDGRPCLGLQTKFLPVFRKATMPKSSINFYSLQCKPFSKSFRCSLLCAKADAGTERNALRSCLKVGGLSSFVYP